MNRATRLFLVLLAVLAANVALSLSITFTVPEGTTPLAWITQAGAQLGLFVATGVVVVALDVALLFGGLGEVEFRPPYTPGAVFGFMTPLLFLSLYFVKRPAGAATFFEALPMTFITIMFYLTMTLLNTITESVRAVKGGRGAG